MKSTNQIFLLGTVIFLFLFSMQLTAQNVGIGTNTPNNSAKLDIESTNSGVLIPRVTLVNIANGTSPVTNPTTGLLVWNTNPSIVGGTGTGFYYWDGTEWIKMSTSTDTDELQTISASSPTSTTDMTFTISPSGNTITENDDDWEINGTGLQGGPGNNVASGANAIAVGANSQASGSYSTAIGVNNTASGSGAIAIGSGNMSTSNSSVAMGFGSTATNTNTLATGGGTANGNGGMAHGGGTAEGANSVALGGLAIAARGDRSVVLGGRFATASGRHEVAIGALNTIYTPVCVGGVCTNGAADRLLSIGNNRIGSNASDALVVQYNGNLIIGSDWSGANGTGTRHTTGSYNLIFNRGTPPSLQPGSLKTAIWNNFGELRVQDEFGNQTVISPHNFSILPEGPSEELAWAYYSERGNKSINVDMAKLARLVERLSGEHLIYIKDKTTGEIKLEDLQTSITNEELQTQLKNQQSIIEQQQLEINELKQLFLDLKNESGK